MTKNTKGGKKHKLLKNSNGRNNNLMVRDNSGFQHYAVIEKYYGHNADVKFIDIIKKEYDETNKEKEEEEKKLISCKGIIRGSIAKKCRLKIGDCVLISVRDYDIKKVDIIFKYSQDDFKELIYLNEVNNDFLKLVGLFDNVKNKSSINNTNLTIEDILAEEISDISFNNNDEPEVIPVEFEDEWGDIDNI